MMGHIAGSIVRGYSGKIYAGSQQQHCDSSLRIVPRQGDNRNPLAEDFDAGAEEVM
jgi:hypothetical protein